MQYQVFVQNESEQHFVTIEVDAEKEANQQKNQMKYAGIFATDPTFDDFMEKLAAIRKQSNAVVDE